MKLNTIIRVLAGLSFLIFFCPFFQMCSDESLKSPFLKNNISTEAVQDSIPLKKTEFNVTSTIDTIIVADTNSAEKADLKREKAIKKNRKEWTFNAYKLGTYAFENSSELKWSDLKEFDLLALIGFTFILLLSIVLLITSFVKKWIAVRNLAITNLVLALFSILIFYFTTVLEDITQIKYGYYLFLINTLAIIILSQKAVQRQKKNTIRQAEVIK